LVKIVINVFYGYRNLPRDQHREKDYRDKDRDRDRDDRFSRSSELRTCFRNFKYDIQNMCFSLQHTNIPILRGTIHD